MICFINLFYKFGVFFTFYDDFYGPFTLVCALAFACLFNLAIAFSE